MGGVGPCPKWQANESSRPVDDLSMKTLEHLMDTTRDNFENTPSTMASAPAPALATHMTMSQVVPGNASQIAP